MVVRLFLHAAGGLLRAAAAARSDGHRRRREESAVAVHRDVRHAARGAAALRCAGGEVAARPVHPHRLSFLRRQSRAVLAAADARHRAGDRRAGVLRLGQRVQSVRGRGVLVVHGRSLHRRAGQTPVRLHRRRRHRRRAARPGHHHRAVGAARPGQSADRRGVFLEVAVFCVYRLERAATARPARRAASAPSRNASAAARSRRCPSCSARPICSASAPGSACCRSARLSSISRRPTSSRPRSMAPARRRAFSPASIWRSAC